MVDKSAENITAAETDATQIIVLPLVLQRVLLLFLSATVEGAINGSALKEGLDFRNTHVYATTYEGGNHVKADNVTKGNCA